MNEREIAMMEANMVDAEENYFNARPIMNTNCSRKIFCDGFKKAWRIKIIDTMIDIKIELHGNIVKEINLLAAQGFLGSTPEAVIEHCLRQYLFDIASRDEKKHEAKQ